MNMEVIFLVALFTVICVFGILFHFFMRRMKTEGLREIDSVKSLFEEKLASSERAVQDKSSTISTLTTDLNGMRDQLNREIEAKASAQSKADRVDQLEKSFRNAESEASSLREKAAEMNARFTECEKSLNEKIALLTSAEDRLTTSFKSLSSDVLAKNNEAFLQLAKNSFEGYKELTVADVESKKKAIEEWITPLQQTLGTMEKARDNAYVSLHEQIKSMAQGNADLKSETSKLMHALRSPSVRGRWGEVQLRRAVEFTGMIKNCDFTEQTSVQNDEGNTLRPDMIMKLPNKRSIVVDAKVPLQAFLEAIETTDDQEHSVKMKTHAGHVRSHIDKLSKKEYWNQFEDSPEFVFIFIPSEAIYSAALQSDPSLIEYGASKNVILATPTSLITLLRVVSHGWKEAHLAENAKLICNQGHLLYERLSKFTSTFDDLRKSIDNTVKNYNSMVGSLETRLLPAARKMKDFGITTNAEIPLLASVELTTRDIRVEIMEDARSVEPVED